MRNNEYTLEGKYVAVVLDYDRASRELAVYIPELMPTFSYTNYKEMKVPVNYGLTTSLTNISNSVTKSNAIWVRAKDIGEKIPTKNSKVMVEFLDGRITLGYWEKLHMTSDSDVISEEKYSKIAELQINNQVIDVFEQDKITIQLPPNYDVITNIEDKNKSFQLVDNNTDYTSMKEQISTLTRNNLYLLSRIKKQLIDTSSKEITDGFDKYIDLTSNYITRDDSLNNEIINLINNKIPELINTTTELYELDPIENKINSLEKLFNILSLIDNKRISYNDDTKYTTLLENVDGRLMDISNNIENNNVVLKYIEYIEKLLLTFRKVSFHYGYEIMVDTDELIEGSDTEHRKVPITSYLDGFEFDGESLSFESKDGESINADKLAIITANPPEFISFSKYFYEFIGWANGSAKAALLNANDVIKIDTDFYPIFIAFEVNILREEDENGYTYKYTLINRTENELISIVSITATIDGETTDITDTLSIDALNPSSTGEQDKFYDLTSIEINVTYTFGNDATPINKKLKIN